MHYSKAIKRPFQDFKKFIIGSLLFMIPFVSIITSLFAYGYIFQCARTAMKKQFKLPLWTGWEELFVRGLLVSVVGVLYFMPALVLTVFFGFAAMWSIISGESYAMFAIGLGLVASSILVILTVYVVPSAILNYTKESTFRSAFCILKIFRKAFTLNYMVAWTVSLFYAIVLSLPASLLIFVLFPTIVGPFIVGGMLAFVLGVTTVTIIGEAYGEIS